MTFANVSPVTLGRFKRIFPFYLYYFLFFKHQIDQIVCPTQRIPTPLFVLEIWKACFTGLIESPEGTEELKWTAFTFLKVRFIKKIITALTESD